MTTQEKQVVWHLAKYHALTCKQAQDELSIGRLSAVVGRLRDMVGYDAITTEYVTGKNKFGCNVTFGVYHVGDAELFGRLEAVANDMDS